jgi:hypothetical protein
MGTKSKNWKITGWWNWNIFQFEIVFFFNCNKKQWLNLKGKEIVGLLWYFKGDTQIEVEKR